ncbi:PP2C family protein-serine/threonine phosphatase [Acidicapsa acidisoli]|uniref:PP2C family protein-serine/threonine phosphatase n=1 Tax=Acidicapsa acidisoli TaxID=1615681 RepID=UPI0021E06776|nr:PP2C family protein-serine/threonine phosphatase [Acidicapsa acidisoli]
MFLRPSRPFRRQGLALLILASILAAAATSNAQSSGGSSTRPAIPDGRELDIKDIGVGAVPIDGNWQFRTGDDPAWAAPGLDDSGWESIRTEKPWGVQGYPAYSGFAWYRRHLHIALNPPPEPGAKPDLLLLMPPVNDAYQVYWNGALIGHIGELPPHASWPVTADRHIFGFPAAGSGVLVIRVWKSPPGSSDSGRLGGPRDPLYIGRHDAIAGIMVGWDYDWLRSNLYTIGLNCLYGGVACLAFLLWLRRRNESLMLWFALFAGLPVVWGILFSLRLPFDSTIASAILQPIYALRNVALWFVLIELLQLKSNRALLRWAQFLAAISLTTGSIDGLLGLAYFVVGWTTHSWIQWTDAIVTAIGTTIEVFPLVIIALGIRRRLDAARWAVASTAFLSHMIMVVTSASKQGERFTHWTLSNLLSTPLFFIQGMYFNAEILADTALFVSILFAVYRYGKEQTTRRSALELEIQQARQIQQLLIPEAIPPVQGYALTSAYQPAREVGGDFFQVIALEDGSTLIALGDVSGKGLHAAMSVSMILGVLRTLADSSLSPAAILTGMNRSLYGRMGDGFATAVFLRITASGRLTLASAGHLPPFLNHRELDLPGSLPLGLTPASSYEETSIEFRPGDQLSLYTDGLLEARNPSGELYGFERLNALFASRPTAEDAAQAAVAFGQDDDITVLTLTRLAATA